MTITKVLKDAKVPFTVHGFRSSFRDWAAETMSRIPDPVAEAALAHVVSDRVIAAYKRTTFVALRRELLDAWGRNLTHEVADAGGSIIGCVSQPVVAWKLPADISA
jgi:integrase